MDQCCDELDQRFDKICEKIEVIFGCGPSIPISQADIPFTVTASGNYCLVESVTTTTTDVAITIDTEIVSLDLNGFSISGGLNAIKAENQNSIVIKNGTLKQAVAESVLTVTCQLICIEQVNFEDNQTACTFQTVDGLKLNRCSFVGHTPDANQAIVDIKNSSAGKIICCTLHDNTLMAPMSSYVVSVANSSNIRFFEIDASNNSNFLKVMRVAQGSSNIQFAECQANNNGTVFGFDIRDSAVCSCTWCTANENSNANMLFGFLSENNQKTVLQNCTSMNNTTTADNSQAIGFQLSDDTASCMLNCFAKQNDVMTTGTGIGFSVSECDNCYVNGNIAIANQLRGYLLNNTSNVFFSNYAQANGAGGTSDNYAVPANTVPIFCYDITAGTFSPIAPRTGPETAWDNISAQTTCS